MLQVISGGMHLLESYHKQLPVADVLRFYHYGSVVRSYLVDLMQQANRREGGLTEIPAYVRDTGEVNGLVGDALQMDVPTPVITPSIMQLLSFRDASPTALSQHGSGRHSFGADDSVRREQELAAR